MACSRYEPDVSRLVPLYEYFLCKWKTFAEHGKKNNETFWSSIKCSYISWYKIENQWDIGATHNSIKLLYTDTRPFPEPLVSKIATLVISL
jgi:hypothetical protein